MDILVKPIVTEKMNAQGEELKRYGFIVDKRANKIQIKRAVEKLYGVTVESVNTLRYASKKKTQFTRSGIIAGKTTALKRAIVTLVEGDTIDFYSNI